MVLEKRTQRSAARIILRILKQGFHQPPKAIVDKQKT